MDYETHSIEKELFKQISNKQFLNHEEHTIEVRSEIIGRIIKFLRKRMSLTQRAVAENIGVAQQTYAGYESGKHEPSIEIAIRLANFYNLSMDYITGRFVGDEQEWLYDRLDEDFDTILNNSAAFFESIELNTNNYMKAICESIKKDSESSNDNTKKNK